MYTLTTQNFNFILAVNTFHIVKITSDYFDKQHTNILKPLNLSAAVKEMQILTCIKTTSNATKSQFQVTHLENSLF